MQILFLLLNYVEKKTDLSDIRPYSALSIRLPGDADFIVADKTYHASKGDIAYIPAYVQYALRANQHEHLYVIHFNESYSGGEIEIFTPKTVNLLIDLFQSAYRCSTNKLPGYSFALSSTFYKILEQMYLQSRQDQKSTIKNFNYALEYIHLNYTKENLTVKELAKIANVSETYFRTLFADMMHITPLKYITELRLSLADELLLSKYYGVVETAQLCGLSDPKYFSTVFKKNRGMSPSSVNRKADWLCEIDKKCQKNIRWLNRSVPALCSLRTGGTTIYYIE